MKVSKKFSNLSNATLVVTAGSLNARLYVLQNGKVVEDEEIRKEKPTYSDREGFFERSTKGKVLGSGSVYEDVQEDNIRNSFLKDLKRHILDLSKSNTIEKVLLFSPAENFGETKKAMPVALRSKVVYEMEGSYYKRPVAALLEKASDAMEKKNSDLKRGFAKKEARKLLKRARK